MFPQDLLEKGLEADNFAMLGLGDIVIPGDGARAGAKVQGVEGDSMEKESSCETTVSLTRRGKKEGLGCTIPPSSPAQGLVKGVHLSTHGAEAWAGPSEEGW